MKSGNEVKKATIADHNHFNKDRQEAKCGQIYRLSYPGFSCFSFLTVVGNKVSFFLTTVKHEDLGTRRLFSCLKQPSTM